MASEALTAADSGALQADVRPVNMAVAGALIFEPGEGTTHEAVLERVRARLHLLPRYRQRLRDPLGKLTNPVWIDDDGFDLGWHVRHARLPDSNLAGYVAREMATHLHRDRPLWELHVVDGLADGRVALLPKMHHALVDGMAALGIGMILLDPSPEPMSIEGDDVEWSPRPFDRRRHLAAGGLSFARGLVNRALDTLDTTPRDVLRATELAAELARQRPQAPMTPLNRPLSPNRAYAMRVTDLPGVKAAGKAVGGTVNDAILALVAGMLREYLGGTDLRGRDPVALVPVSVRREGDDEGGNRISTVFVDLPVHEPDLSARISAVGEQMRALRESAAVRAGAILVGAAGQAGPLIGSMIGRATGAVRAMNIVVSNVPGPQLPFYMNGARLLEVYPAVPLNPANQGLNVGVMSYDGRVFFGLCADSRLDPPVQRAAEALDTALEDLAL